MPVLLSWTDSQGVQNEVIFSDAIMSDTINSAMDVTTFPVEEGSPITDNVRPVPQEIGFDILVSAVPLDIQGGSKQTLTLNVPKPKNISANRLIDSANAALGSLAGVRTGGTQAGSVETYVPPQGHDFVTETEELLNVLQGRGTPEPPALLTVTSTNRRLHAGTYVLKNFNRRRSAEEGAGAAFTLELVEIQFAYVKVVPTPKPTAVRANAKKSKGTKDAKKPTPEKKASVAVVLVDTAKGLLAGGSP